METLILHAATMSFFLNNWSGGDLSKKDLIFKMPLLGWLIENCTPFRKSRGTCFCFVVTIPISFEDRIERTLKYSQGSDQLAIVNQNLRVCALVKLNLYFCSCRKSCCKVERSNPLIVFCVAWTIQSEVIIA